MSEQLSTPRITAAYLDNFVGKVVMLVGKVTQLRGEQATLDSDGTVTVLLNRVSWHQIWCQCHDIRMHCNLELTTFTGCPSYKW
jgi:hypothetical protein